MEERQKVKKISKKRKLEGGEEVDSPKVMFSWENSLLLQILLRLSEKPHNILFKCNKFNKSTVLGKNGTVKDVTSVVTKMGLL